MPVAAPKLSVLVGERFACVKIAGRANFSSSIDFRALMRELLARGYEYFVLDLSECMLMDSTFLGVLSDFGLKLNRGDNEQAVIELLNPNARITELLENLGVLHLFKLTQGPLMGPVEGEIHTPAPTQPTKEEITRACLEAHHTLMQINPENVARFKELTAFLSEDLKKLKGPAK